jgi:hypothetical protein
MKEREEKKKSSSIIPILCVMHVFNYICVCVLLGAAIRSSSYLVFSTLLFFYSTWCERGGDDRSSLKPYTDIYVEKGKEKKINSGDMMECQRPGIINVYASGSSLSSC